jgi:hypothetical protein
MGNPVHMAALCVAGLALVGYRAGAARDRRGRLAWLAAAAAVGGALQLSGGRTGLALGAGLVGWLAHRFGARCALGLLVAVVAGALLAGVVAGAGTVSASSRAARDQAGGVTGRLDRWALAVPALEERPLLGFGPGQFRRATAAHTTAAAARAFGPDTLSEDAHDVVVEYATTTGILGVVALGVWLAYAGRRARGALAAFAVLGGCSLLVQPQSVALTPVLLLALGAAAPQPTLRRLPGARAIAVGTAVIGAAAGLLLLRGDGLLHRATDGLRTADARAASAALPAWSVGPATEARAAAYEGLTTHSDRAGSAVLAAARAAVDRDRSDPRRWNELGGYELRWGSRAAGRRAFVAASRANPWSVRALRARARLAREDGDEAAVRRLCARVRTVVPGGRCGGGGRR